MKYSLFVVMIIAACSNSFVERTASDYFPLDEGNWWRYVDSVLYNPSIMYVEVEPRDTVLQVECFPVSISGELKYYARSGGLIREYVRLTYNFSGDDYIVAEGFVTRLELPFVSGNAFIDSVSDSLEVSGVKVKGRYKIEGFVSGYEHEEYYGDVYKLVVSISETVELPDTIYMTATSYDEYYAPEIGLVRFRNDQGMFSLVEYYLQ